MKSIFILLAVLTASAVMAADEPVRVETVPADPATAPALQREPTPMMKEILASQEAGRLEIAELKERYDTTTDDQTALEIMREVARVKREMRIEMMRIQLRYARDRGDEKAIAELEEIVARLEAPPRSGVPIPRAPNHQ